MKKILITSMVLVVALVANADVLYWMVSDQYAQSADSSSSAEFAYLKVSDQDSNTSGNIQTLATKSASEVYNAYDYGDAFSYTIPSTYEGTSPTYYFFVELANGSLKTDPMSLAALKNAGYIYTGGTQLPSTLASTGFGQATGTAYNVPEPTSGLLFLVGGVLLGLRRRRQQV